MNYKEEMLWLVNHDFKPVPALTTDSWFGTTCYTILWELELDGFKVQLSKDGGQWKSVVKSLNAAYRFIGVGAGESCLINSVRDVVLSMESNDKSEWASLIRSKLLHRIS